MTVRLITGPPGAGKNTYIDKHKKDGDFIFDFDELRAQYPHMTLDQLKAMRETIYGSLQTLDRDAWVIQCIAKPEKRTEIAQKIGAEEVVVLETPADVAKERVRERGREPERNGDVFAAIDEWWSQYGVVSSDVIVKPDMGDLSDRKNQMTSQNEDQDKGFPADTPLAEMTTEQQLAYWKHQSRKHENNYKNLGNVEELKTKAQKWDEANPPKPPANDDDKSGKPIDVDALRKQIALEIKLEAAPELVRTQFKGLIGDRVSEERLTGILEDLDTKKYVKEDGSVDVDRIKSKAELLAPADSSSTQRRTTTRTHQGHREGQKGSSVQAGKDLFAEFAKKK